MSEVNPKPEALSRRNVLKGMFATVTGVLLGIRPSGPATEPPPLHESAQPTATPEKEPQQTASIAVVDFFQSEEFWQEMIQSTLARDGIEEASLWQQMGVDAESSTTDFQAAYPQTDQEATLLLLKYLQERYREHGAQVTQAAEKMTARVGGETSAAATQETSVESAIRVHSITRDELGNYELRLLVSAKIVDELLRESTASIVNLSLQLGIVGVRWEMNGWKSKHENPEALLSHIQVKRKVINAQTKEVISPARYLDTTTGEELSEEVYQSLVDEAYSSVSTPLPPADREMIILDGYAHENTLENLTYLTQLATHHPEKLFIAAAGNPVLDNGVRFPDIRSARDSLVSQGKWPDNLLICGVWGMQNGSELPLAYGADIYVRFEDLEAIDFGQASSFATPIVSAVAQQLSPAGEFNPDQLRQKLLSLTSAEEICFGTECTTYRVLDLQAARAAVVESE